MSLTPWEFSNSPLAGMDFSWIAVDTEGHVAWLVTFGSAVAPKWVEERSGDFDPVEDLLAVLPERSGCTARETSSNIEQWRAAARRGVFAYDWAVYDGPYRMLTAPTEPLRVEDLPIELATLARRTRFPNLRFRDQPDLQIHDVLACERGEPPAAS